MVVATTDHRNEQRCTLLGLPDAGQQMLSVTWIQVRRMQTVHDRFGYLGLNWMHHPDLSLRKNIESNYISFLNKFVCLAALFHQV